MIWFGKTYLPTPEELQNLNNNHQKETDLNRTYVSDIHLIHCVGPFVNDISHFPGDHLDWVNDLNFKQRDHAVCWVDWSLDADSSSEDDQGGCNWYSGGTSFGGGGPYWGYCSNDRSIFHDDEEEANKIIEEKNDWNG